MPTIYFDENDNDWLLCTALSIDWGDAKSHRFIAYLVLAHKLNRPPSDAAINAFVDNYADRFQVGQEWIITEDEAWQFAIAETV